MKPLYNLARFPREQGKKWGDADTFCPLFSLSCLSSVKVTVMVDFVTPCHQPRAQCLASS